MKYPEIWDTEEKTRISEIESGGEIQIKDTENILNKIIDYFHSLKGDDYKRHTEH